MTSTTSGKSRCFMDFDNQKNQEWLRRRRMRLEQVRKQSHEIAKVLRERLIKNDSARYDEFDRVSEAKFRDWKAEKIEELETKLRWALEEFGQSYRLAREEFDSKEVIEMGKEINMAKAQKRGEIAKQEELKMKKTAEEKKILPILRKQLTRKKEDLRAALLRSVPLKNQLINLHEAEKDNICIDKTPGKKIRKTKVSAHKSCKCRPNTVTVSKPLDDRVWINLNELQHSSTVESGLEAKSSKSSTYSGKIHEDRPEGMVEFYDFSSRYHCKSFKGFPYSVERIDSTTEMPDANKLAQLENEKDKFNEKKRLEADALSQERGLEALRREKIRREYSKLISRLEELNRKERILKSQRRNFPDFLHMTDERLSERERTKQRIMDTKFESIYYKAIEQISQIQPSLPELALCQGGGDYLEANDRSPTKLSSSSSNLKLNTPVTSNLEDSEDLSSNTTIKQKKKTRKKKELLVDIDNALKKGRELRKTISGKQNPKSEKEEEEEEEEEEEKKERQKFTSDIVTQTDFVEASQRDERTMTESQESPKVEGKMTKSQESQTEDLMETDLKMFDKVDDSVPASSATSYKSPPSVIRPFCLRDFLDYLEGISEAEDVSRMRNKSKVDGLTHDILPLSNNKSDEVEDDSSESPTLEYYVEKLLNMSRECIANLSVSSENFSTPNLRDLDKKNVQKSENSSQKSNLEESIRNWKTILEKNSEKSSSEPEDNPQLELADSDDEENKEINVNAICHPEIQSKYEEITKKCSERISELSNMLEKVRKDKEKLLGSASGRSSFSLTKEKEPSEDEEEDEKTQQYRETPLTSLVFKEYSNDPAELSRLYDLMLYIDENIEEDAMKKAFQVILKFHKEQLDKLRKSRKDNRMPKGVTRDEFYETIDPLERAMVLYEFYQILRSERKKALRKSPSPGAAQVQDSANQNPAETAELDSCESSGLVVENESNECEQSAQEDSADSAECVQDF